MCVTRWLNSSYPSLPRPVVCSYLPLALLLLPQRIIVSWASPAADNGVVALPASSPLFLHLPTSNLQIFVDLPCLVSHEQATKHGRRTGADLARTPTPLATSDLRQQWLTRSDRLIQDDAKTKWWPHVWSSGGFSPLWYGVIRWLMYPRGWQTIRPDLAPLCQVNGCVDSHKPTK